MSLALSSTGSDEETKRKKDSWEERREAKGSNGAGFKELGPESPWRAFLSPQAGFYLHHWHMGNGRCGHILCGSTRWWPRLLGSWNKSGEERVEMGECATEGLGRWAIQVGPATLPQNGPQKSVGKRVRMGH